MVFHVYSMGTSSSDCVTLPSFSRSIWSSLISDPNASGSADGRSVCRGEPAPDKRAAVVCCRAKRGRGSATLLEHLLRSLGEIAEVLGEFFESLVALLAIELCEALPLRYWVDLHGGSIAARLAPPQE